MLLFVKFKQFTFYKRLFYNKNFNVENINRIT